MEIVSNATATEPVTLYDWPPSPFCMKVRALLRHKNVAYRRVPALSHLRELKRRGGVGKVPALELDGTFLVDSTDIAHALERRFPAPPALPASARERALCHAFEDWADESLYFLGLYYHWHERTGRRQVAAYFGRTAFGKLAFPPYLFRVERQLRGQGTARKTPAHVRADLERNLDAIEALLSDTDYLLGSGPYLCDFALMSQLVYLTLAPATSDVLERRPSARRFVERLRPSPS
jgi:glutathione S-transferase